MEFVVLRKLVPAVLMLLMATGFIKVEFIQKNVWAKYVSYLLGILLLIAAALYQFNIIPEGSQDSLLQ